MRTKCLEKDVSYFFLEEIRMDNVCNLDLSRGSHLEFMQLFFNVLFDIKSCKLVTRINVGEMLVDEFCSSC